MRIQLPNSSVSGQQEPQRIRRGEIAQMRHISYIPKRGIRRRRVSGLEQVSATRGQTGFAARIGLWAEDMAPVRLSHCDGGSDRRRGLRATAEAQYRDWALSESDSQTLHLLGGCRPVNGFSRRLF